jgi:phage tail sheath gpL-like
MSSYPATAFTSSVSMTRPANTTAYAAGDAIGVDAGTSQVETATAAGTITAAVAQVETATAAGTITLAGNATVVVTGAALENSPKTFSVAVALNDTDATWAGKVRTALAADENIDDAYVVSGATTAIILTAKSAAANDATLNISLDNGTCTGITTAASSANTTAGVASGAGNATVVVTAARILTSPVTVSVAVAAGDTAATWAGKVRTALNATAAITAIYTVGGASTSITLTETTPAANDATLNISLDNGTCTGITAAPTSTDTTAGSVSTTNAGSAIMSFDMKAPKGSQVLITDVNLQWHVSSLPSGASTFRLHLYNASPDAVLDNAAWDLSSAGDLGKYLGYVELVTPQDLGSTLYSANSNVNKLVKLAADSQTLYGVLQTVGAYTPTSAAVYKTEIQALAA